MTIEVYIQNSEDGKVYDVSTLCGTITYDSYLNGQPGKCTATLQEDPNGILRINSGSKFMFKVNGEGVFYGYIFIMGTDATGTYKITAYDQMRYLKNEEIYYTENMTSDQIFEMICAQAELKYQVKYRSNYIVPKYMHDKKTRYAIIEYGLDQTLIGSKKLCFVRDDYGTLIHTEVGIEKTNLVIGDKSLLMNYKYEISIDKDTFNEVKVYKNNEDSGKREVYIIKDSNNQKRWGNLRNLTEAKGEANESQIIQLAETILKAKNRETKTMKLNALGFTKPILRAGNGFSVWIEKLNIKEDMWIESITHTFQKDLHTMSMDVFI